MAHRRKRLAESDIAIILESLKELPITVDSPDANAAIRLPVLALKHQITAYDAAYLELALRLKLPIATKDAAMKRAMLASGIETVRP